MSDTVRVDKWLWAARFFKSRTQATAACDGGHVKVEGTAAKPSRAVRVGETVEVVFGPRTKILRVVALAEKRGPASVAQTLYEDLTPPEPPAARYERAPGFDAGRPTKRDRRDLREAKRRF